jgi:hypothetical protein
MQNMLWRPLQYLKEKLEDFEQFEDLSQSTNSCSEVETFNDCKSQRADSKANQQQTSCSLCDRFWKKATNSTSQLIISSKTSRKHTTPYTEKKLC